MLGVLISLVVFSFCFIVILINLKYFLINKFINVYFIILIFFVGVQRLLYAISELRMLKVKFIDFDYKFYLIFITPIYFLFLKNLLEFKKYNSTNFKFFIPFLVILLMSFFNIPWFDSYFLVITLITMVFYISYSFILLNKFYKTRRLQSKLNIRIYRFGLFSFIFLFLITLSIFGYVFIHNLGLMDKSTIFRSVFIFSTIIWFFWLLYLLMNPILLYGEDCLISQINYSQNKEIKIWLSKTNYNLIEKNIAETIIENQLEGKIDNIILEIKKLELDYSFISQKEMNLENISQKIKIPKYHLKYIFKYHCNLTQLEYQNFIKVKLAINLIENNYLKDKTVDSLSLDSLFTSRVTMYKYFKKFHNQTPLEYNNLFFSN